MPQKAQAQTESRVLEINTLIAKANVIDNQMENLKVTDYSNSKRHRDR